MHNKEKQEYLYKKNGVTGQMKYCRYCPYRSVVIPYTCKTPMLANMYLLCAKAHNKMKR